MEYTKQYYTPEVNEFCDGFEFEVQKLDFVKGGIVWWQEIYLLGRNFANPLIDMLENKEIRVKSLDKSDIESLGYYESKENAYQFYPNEANAEYINGIQDHYIIVHHSGKVQIDTHYETVYFGTIRNLFHLRQILKDVA